MSVKGEAKPLSAENVSFGRKKKEAARNVLKRKNMQRHFQNSFVRVSPNTC